jgi:hypothetical protein
MAVGNGVDNLEEDGTNELVVANVPLALRDHGEQVTARAVVENDKDVLVFLNNLVDAGNVVVAGCELVESNLATLKVALPPVKTCARETLDSCVVVRSPWVAGAGTNIDSKIHNAVCSIAEDGGQFPSPVVDNPPSEIASSSGKVFGHGGKGIEKVWSGE